MNWKEFEKSSAEYLSKSKTFEGIAEFTHMGCSDSTTSDILVQTKDRKFFMEVKKASSQCGQFVLFPNENNKSFEFSDKNKTPLNSYAQSIIDFMNKNYEKFVKAGTKGVVIDFDNCNEIFKNWILETAKQKNVRFYMTKGYTIFKSEDIDKYFTIKAKYRTKKSGSSNAGKQHRTELIEHLKTLGIASEDIETAGAKLFVKTDKNIDKNFFDFNGNTYMFAARNNRYEVRKLSNTRNSNVIFSLKYNGRKGLSEKEFAELLQNV